MFTEARPMPTMMIIFLLVIIIICLSDSAVSETIISSPREINKPEPDGDGDDHRAVSFRRRRNLLQLFDFRSYWNDLPMDCINNDDCSQWGIRMACISNKCACELKDYVFLVEKGCYPTANLFHHCITSEQCTALNKNSYCNQSKRCTCTTGYYFDGRDCIFRYDSNLKAQEVYKAAVVAAACFIVAVVGIFVACIVRRSFCRREANVQHSDSTSSDVFSVSDEIAALRAVDKPPSYEEVLQIERTFYGIPPPEYTFVGNSNITPPSGQLSFPDLEDHPPAPPWQEANPDHHQTNNSSPSITSSQNSSNNCVTVAAVITSSAETCEQSSQTIDTATSTVRAERGECNAAAAAVDFLPQHQQQSDSLAGLCSVVLQPIQLDIMRSSKHRCFTPPLSRPPYVPIQVLCLSAPSSPNRRHLPSSPTHRSTPTQTLTMETDSVIESGERTVEESMLTEDHQLSESGSVQDIRDTSVAYDNPAFIEDQEK